MKPKIEIINPKISEDKQESFWYHELEIARIIVSPKKWLCVEATGIIDVVFKEGGKRYLGYEAVKFATLKGYTDKNLYAANYFDGWHSFNWFSINWRDGEGDMIVTDLAICNSYDEAILKLEEFLEFETYT